MVTGDDSRDRRRACLRFAFAFMLRSQLACAVWRPGEADRVGACVFGGRAERPITEVETAAHEIDLETQRGRSSAFLSFRKEAF
jgi:hypothetical protein